VKRGFRFVHGDIELLEKLGRNDPCPCGSGRRFQGMLPGRRPLSMGRNAMIITGKGRWAASRRRGPISPVAQPRQRSIQHCLPSCHCSEDEEPNHQSRLLRNVESGFAVKRGGFRCYRPETSLFRASFSLLLHNSENIA